jgi:hypothetical protein
MRKILIWTICLLLTAFVVNANAVPISFTHEGIGSGTLGSTSFSDAEFTITAQGDTMNRSLISSPYIGFYIEHDSASIFIASLGTFDFITDTRTFVNNTFGGVGFSRAGATGADLFDGPSNSGAFGSWDMLSSIGPITGSGGLEQWTSPYPDVITNAGVLVFKGGSSPATFQATIAPVPEPSTMLLLGSGLIGLVGYGRKKLFRK